PGGATGDAAEKTNQAPPAAAPVPADSPLAARLLADRTLKGGGPVLFTPPLRASVFPYALPGWADLSAGFSVGDGSRWENIALNSQLELAPGLRGHFTGVYRTRTEKIRADLSWQEGYIEGYGFRSLLGGRLGWNVRVGRTANLPWPYPDHLSL